MGIERDIVKEHVRHFLDRVESLISIAQWHQFDALTNECKSWIQRELLETTKALNFLLTPDQIMQVKAITRKLNAQLASIIQEYAIVTPRHEIAAYHQ